MKTLLEKEGILRPSDSKSHIIYEFQLERESKRLNIFFSYSPKFLDDREKARDLIVKNLSAYMDECPEKAVDSWEEYLPLKNLVTLSFDDPSGFRGAAHRHPSTQSLFITPECASPGLLPGTLNIGKWRVVVSAHAVVTEVCSYQLRIWEGDK